MNTLELQVITPEKSLVFSRIRSVVLDCPDGKRGILPGHEPSLFEVAIGTLRCVDDAGKEHYFAVAGGIAEVTPQRVVLATSSIEEAHEIDVERAREALQRAEKRLRDRARETDLVRARAALLRALTRLRVSESLQKK